MTFFLDKTQIRWDHVRMLVQECRNNETIARAAVEGIEDEFTRSIRRMAVVKDGKVSFVAEAKIEAPVEGAAKKDNDRGIETLVSDLTFGPSFLLESLMKMATGSLKKAWRMIWP